MTSPLEPGHELHCPHCRRWHPVYKPHTEGTEATVTMAYFDCRGLRYFAGFIGSPSRYETRSIRGSTSHARRARGRTYRALRAGTRSSTRPRLTIAWRNPRSQWTI